MNDDLNPDARRLVDLARKARTPGAGDKLRIAERLAVPLAASAALGTAVGTAKATASTGLLGSLGVKVAAVVAVGAVTTALVVGQLGSKSNVVATPKRAAPAQAVPAARGPEVNAPEPAAADADTQPEPASRHKSSTLPGTHSAKPADELAQEAALLHEAQSAWRAGQSAQALQLANQHAQRFPRSQLANERDVLRVLSLCKLGQTQAAKQVGARLLKKAKGSPWYQSVAESCAGN